MFGHRPGSAKARARMGVTSQTAGFPGQLTPRELLTYAQARRGDRAPFDDVTTAFGLGPLLDRRIAGFSGGEVRRVALALAFLGRPGLVFLDEPTAGLDIAAQEAFALTARAFVKNGGALILMSHDWAEIETICDRITMIDKGRKVLDGSLAEMRARMQARLVGFDLPEGDQPPDWLPARQQGGHWCVETEDSDSMLRRMPGEGLGFRDLTVKPLDLSDIIASIARKDIP
jgi:ABC-2 type transport system ATP-binding protein